MATDRENQIGGILYVVGVLIAGVMAVFLWPLSAIAWLIWEPPPEDLGKYMYPEDWFT